MSSQGSLASETGRARRSRSWSETTLESTAFSQGSGSRGRPRLAAASSIRANALCTASRAASASPRRRAAQRSRPARCGSSALTQAKVGSSRLVLAVVTRLLTSAFRAMPRSNLSTAEVQRHGSARARGWGGSQHLVQRHVEVHHVAVQQPEPTLEVERRLNVTVQDAPAHVGREPVQLREDAIPPRVAGCRPRSRHQRARTGRRERARMRAPADGVGPYSRGRRRIAVQPFRIEPGASS